MNQKDIDWLKTSFIAHRGLHQKDANIPENSKSAFSLAIEQGYGIECDVRISKDNIIYVFHDKNVKRMCNIDAKFESLTSQEINSLKLLNTNEGIITVGELLELVNSSVPLLIEIKSTKRYKIVCKEISRQLCNYNGIYAIQSFNPLIVNWFRKHQKNVSRGIIAESHGHPYQGRFLIWKLYHTGLFNKISNPDFYNFNIKDLPNKAMDKFKKKGGTVISFTARSEEDLLFVKKHYHNAVFELFIPNKKSL